MKKTTEPGFSLPCPSCFDLNATLSCGQCFRWETRPECPDVWQGVAFDRQVRVWQQDGRLCFSCTQQEFEQVWRAYFDLDADYEEICRSLCAAVPRLQCAAGACSGIRILRQEPWEALCSFILSQNNNIPRIKGIICRLCENFGQPVGESHTFPTAEKIAGCTLEQLAVLRSGFRAKYVLAAAKAVQQGEIDLAALQKMPGPQTAPVLQKLCGVGPKVANCVQLYGLHQLDAFPVDVWMKRAMRRYFPGQDGSIFGPYAGVAQQYLFHYIRTCESDAPVGS